MKDKEKIFELLRGSVETPQESFAVEEMIRKVEGNLPQVEVVDETHQKFNGIIYCTSRAPQMKGRYFKLLSLHRMVWTCYNGEIPEGYDIHHKDFDKNNNDISNLVALPKSVHQSLHARTNSLKTRKNRRKFICVNCGCEYEADDNGHNCYCSKKCLEEYKKMFFMLKLAFVLTAARSFQIIVMDIKNFAVINTRLTTIKKATNYAAVDNDNENFIVGHASFEAVDEFATSHFRETFSNFRHNAAGDVDDFIFLGSVKQIV